MTDLGELRLSHNEKQALYEAKKELLKKYPVAKTLVFGSVARCEADEELDLDILVLTERVYLSIEKFTTVITKKLTTKGEKICPSVKDILVLNYYCYYHYL
ncbi:MAG: nucleotidyltransferase family protein, partial [Bacillota bacterium]